MTDEVPAQIVVNPSPAGDQAATATRDVLLILAALPAFIALLGKRDVIQVVNFLSSVDGLPIVSLIIVPGVIAWRQWLARRNKARMVTVAEAAPNRVAVVK